MALAIYRKYRPASWEELLGQETTVKILKNAAIRDRIAHAYLFTGMRGTGKTTTARLIAKVLNCKKRLTDEKFRETGEPCGECRVCREIDEGRALDVVEIDAASNRGIDEIRNLKESVRSAPTSYTYKVFIIDEAHQLTKEAFNALLKTLEEPPANVVIILATTELDKIPPTISSRTQIFRFRKAPLSLIAAKLKLIARKEKTHLADDALELIAASSDGSFRDAESMLDQLVSFGYANLKIEDIENMFGRVGFSKVSGFAGLLIAKKTEQSLEQLASLADEGFNLAHFVKDLIGYLRRALVLKLNPGMENLFKEEMTAEGLKTLKEHVNLIREKDQILLLKNLISAYGQMKYSQFPIIPLEVAIVESLHHNPALDPKP